MDVVERERAAAWLPCWTWTLLHLHHLSQRAQDCGWLCVGGQQRVTDNNSIVAVLTCQSLFQISCEWMARQQQARGSFDHTAAHHIARA